MTRDQRIRKILLGLWDGNGELSRSQISETLFHRNMSKIELDELLGAPELADLIATTRCPRRGGGTGRYSRRYSLTIAGWSLLATGLKRGVVPLAANREMVEHWLAGLVKDRDRWATELVRQAAVGREHEAAERRKKMEASEARRVAAKARKRPSDGRHRSPADRAARQQFFDGKMLAQGKVRNAEGKYRSVEEIPNVEPQATRAPDPETARRGIQQLDWQRYVTAPVRPANFMPTSDTAPSTPDKSTSALLTRIQHAGYRTQGGRVLFDGAWIDPHEWQRRMPGCLD